MPVSSERKSLTVIQQLDIPPTEREVLASLALDHPASKRTPEARARVLAMARGGATRKAIAAAVGFSPALLSGVLRQLRGAGLIST